MEASAVRSPGVLRKARLAVEGMRPRQWVKNAFVFGGVLYSGQFVEVGPLSTAIAVFVAFCLASGAAYLVNDAVDAETDRMNPRTAGRPIARGELSPRTAIVVAVVADVAALAIAALVNWETLATLGGFIALQAAYSTFLKHQLFIDVMAVAGGFVLRAYAGLVSIDVEISEWLLLCTGLLALFLGFGKRRNELSTLEGAAGQHRANLDSYSLPMLDQMIVFVSAAIVISYSLYTFDAPSAPDNRAMMLTIPFLLYALFRYLYLIYRQELGGSPEVLLVTDRPILACIAGWALAVLLIIYLA